MSIAENIRLVRSRISEAATVSGRDASEIVLIAVTKTLETEQILEAIDAGITDIGENYVQETLTKFEVIGRKVRWHMIGHLQTNKVRQVVPIFDLIQSVDSISLANEIGKRSIAVGKISRVLVEVNISGEQSKSGVHPESAMQLCEAVSKVDGIALDGMMGIAPFTDDAGDIRKSFAGLKSLWDKLPAENKTWLSMGMTSDFEMAIEEGANMVRIGTAIFGPRVRPH